MRDGTFYLGIIRLHILHHAAEEPVFGAAIAAELARHGYGVGAGTLYPILHGLEKKGYLRRDPARKAGARPRYYVATPQGRAALERAREKVRELFDELSGGSARGRRRSARRPAPR
jgi:DNA-binding PadR family transcriptional regulator